MEGYWAAEVAMTILAVAAALALAAGEALPFPPPRLVQVTERTKCDTGTVLTVEPERSTFQATTPAGVVTYRAGADVQVLDKDGKPLGSIAKLAVGQKVRVYYVVDDGARVQEVDLDR